MQDMKALDVLTMLLKEYRHDDDDVILIQEAISEIQKLQEENEHLKNMLGAYKKDKV